MLVLERKEGDSIIIQDGDDIIKLKFEKGKGAGMKVCIDAPERFKIFRDELLTQGKS